MEEPQTLHATHSSHHVLWERLFLDEESKDTELRFASGSVFVHSVILHNAGSAALADMTSEEGTLNDATVTLMDDDVCQHDMAALIKAVYLGSISNITHDAVRSLMKIARQMNIRSIQEKCELVLSKNMTEDDVMENLELVMEIDGPDQEQSVSSMKSECATLKNVLAKYLRENSDFYENQIQNLNLPQLKYILKGMIPNSFPKDLNWLVRRQRFADGNSPSLSSCLQRLDFGFTMEEVKKCMEQQLLAPSQVTQLQQLHLQMDKQKTSRPPKTEVTFQPKYSYDPETENLRENLFCDHASKDVRITFEAGEHGHIAEKQLLAHSIVLRNSGSVVLRNLLKDGSLDGNSREKFLLKFGAGSEVTFGGMRRILSFLYLDRIPDASLDVIVEILPSGVSLGLVSLMQACQDFLLHHLNERNLVAVVQAALKSDLLQVKSAAVQFLEKRRFYLNEEVLPDVQLEVMWFILKETSHFRDRQPQEEFTFWLLRWAKVQKLQMGHFLEILRKLKVDVPADQLIEAMARNILTSKEIIDINRIIRKRRSKDVPTNSALPILTSVPNQDNLLHSNNNNNSSKNSNSNNNDSIISSPFNSRHQSPPIIENQDRSHRDDDSSSDHASAASNTNRSHISDSASRVKKAVANRLADDMANAITDDKADDITDDKADDKADDITDEMADDKADDITDEMADVKADDIADDNADDTKPKKKKSKKRKKEEAKGKKVKKSKSSSSPKWKHYLRDNNLEAAPTTAFMHHWPPPEHDFEKGMFLEVHDPELCVKAAARWDSSYVAEIKQVRGYRLELQLVLTDGNDPLNHFWKVVDSCCLKPLGFTQQAYGRPPDPPPGLSVDIINWKRKITTKIDKIRKAEEEAPDDLFLDEPKRPATNMFVVGQRLEAVDKKNPMLLCPARIDAIEGDRLQVAFEGYGDVFSYWCDRSDRIIFPVQWHKKTGDVLQPMGKDKPKS